MRSNSDQNTEGLFTMQSADQLSSDKEPHTMYTNYQYSSAMQ